MATLYQNGRKIAGTSNYAENIYMDDTKASTVKDQIEEIADNLDMESIPESLGESVGEAISSLNSKLTDNGKSFKFGYDGDSGKYGYYKADDSFAPFLTEKSVISSGCYATNTSTKTITIPIDATEAYVVTHGEAGENSDTAKSRAEITVSSNITKTQLQLISVTSATGKYAWMGVYKLTKDDTATGTFKLPIYCWGGYVIQ